VKVVGLCSFYDESPTWLAAHPAACARLVDHMIYVDGAYFLYDKDGRSSGVEAHDAIATGCEAAGIGHTLFVPDTPWMGNEVEKRSFMFQLAEQMTTEEDWYVVIDADTFLIDGDCARARNQMSSGEYEAYDVHLVERWDWNTGQDGSSIVPTDNPGAPNKSSSPLTCVFKALRGLRVFGAHYLFAVQDPDWKWGLKALWGPSTEYDVVPHGQLNLDFEHRNKLRTFDRAQAARDYYRVRDDAKVERTQRNFIETVDGDIAEL
jgi:hypothetical protein